MVIHIFGGDYIALLKIICGYVDDSALVIIIYGDVDIVLVINHLRYLQALESCDLKKLITNVGSGVGAAPAAGGRLFPNFLP